MAESGRPVGLALEGVAGQPWRGRGPRILRGPVYRCSVRPDQAKRREHPEAMVVVLLRIKRGHEQHAPGPGGLAHQRPKRAGAEFDEDVRTVVKQLPQISVKSFSLATLLDHRFRDDPAGVPPLRQFLGPCRRASWYQQGDVWVAGGGVVVGGEVGVWGVGGEMVEGLGEVVGGGGGDGGAVGEGGAGGGG